MKKYMLALVLAVASLGAFARPVITTQPPVVVTSVVPESASGYWYSQQVSGLQVVLVTGKYFASMTGSSATCGKILKTTVGIPRVGPISGLFSATGQAVDSNGVGIPYGTILNLISKNTLAGTISITNYDSATGYLEVYISTPAGGPNGSYLLNRDPLTPSTALIVPNCQ